MTQRHNINAAKKPKMQLKILLYMIIFSAVILSVIWLLQTVFLDDIYKSIKENGIISDTAYVSEILGRDDADQKIYDLAQRSNTCISVYEVNKGHATEIVSAHIQPHCLIHSTFNDGLLSSAYEGAKEQKIYTKYIDAHNKNFSDSIISSAACSINGIEMLVVLNTEVQPVGATLTTLRYLLIWITVIIAAVSVVVSFLISRAITRPVAKMNDEAKRLAVGNYDVNFNGGDFLETSELAATLNYAADQLSQLDNMQKELIANISHDLRTPLTMISGYSEVMRDIPGEMTPENIQIIIDETARLSSLVSDMLDLSRLTGGSRTLKTSVFSLTECTRATLERYNRLRERDGYRFISDFDGDHMVEADETLILQVVYNLINNAINYTGDDKTVTVSIRENGGVCRLSVSDTGEGIPPEKLPLIWDRYYKASEHHRRGVMGTGLGLSIVKNALILHGADFGVSSTVGSGSTFWFELKTVDQSEPK